MKLPYRVHSVATEPVTVDATVDGETVQATVQQMVVELVSLDGANSQTLRLRGTKAERTELSLRMTPGARVDLEISFPEA